MKPNLSILLDTTLFGLQISDIDFRLERLAQEAKIVRYTPYFCWFAHIGRRRAYAKLAARRLLSACFSCLAANIQSASWSVGEFSRFSSSRHLRYGCKGAYNWHYGFAIRWGALLANSRSDLVGLGWQR